jgi:large subunit ribosomal protein L6
MKENVYLEIPITAGIEVSLNENILRIKGKGGEIKKKVAHFTFPIKIEGNKIILENKKSNRKHKAGIYAMAANIRNMLNGVENPYHYELQICTVHFPVTVSIDEKRKLLLIKNFLAERLERQAKILDNVKVEIKGDKIMIDSVDVDAAGQTAANIETATKVRNKDRRIFQDGIFIIEKAGEKII